MLLENKINILKEKINHTDEIVILTHLNPDHDSIGSCFALKEIISNNYNKVVHVCSEVNQFYSHFAYDDSANCSKDDVLVIALDCANTERLSSKEYDLSNSIKIDHHPNNDPYSLLNIVDESYSSTSELLVDICNELELKISTKAAALLFLGIVGDTGRFLFKNVTVNTYRVSKFLIDLGMNPIEDVYDHIYNVTIREVYMKSLLMKHFVLEKDIGHLILDENSMSTLGISRNDVSKFTNQFGSIREVKIWVTCVFDMGIYKCSIRSKKKNINDIAQKYGGGGHPLASGLVIDNIDTIYDVIDDIKERLYNG